MAGRSNVGTSTRVQTEKACAEGTHTPSVVRASLGAVVGVRSDGARDRSGAEGGEVGRVDRARLEGGFGMFVEVARGIYHA